MRTILDRARRDAAAYADGGVDALIVENFGDAPFFKADLAAETIAALTRCAAAVRDEVTLPLGINALRNDARGALGVAVATDASFIRVNVHAGVTATDQGLIEGRAADTLRARTALNAPVKILADVHVKHGRPLFADDLVQAARDLIERGGADALVLSGASTGSPTDVDDLGRVREALPDATLLAGSGVTLRDVSRILAHADGVIVGTALKRGGKTTAPADRARVRRFVSAARAASPRSRRSR
jgi:membrane complex biogenesis BtpA family protein